MRHFRRLILAFGFALALLVPAGAASAAPVESIREEQVRLAINFCNGDTVVVTGILHTVQKVAADGSVSLRVQYHAKGTSTRGDKYEVSLIRKFERDAPGNFTEVIRTSLISQGSAPNQTIIIHSSFTTDGGFVFEAENFCKG